jgi:hypothetical protein
MGQVQFFMCVQIYRIYLLYPRDTQARDSIVRFSHFLASFSKRQGLGPESFLNCKLNLEFAYINGFLRIPRFHPKHKVSLRVCAETLDMIRKRSVLKTMLSFTSCFW